MEIRREWRRKESVTVVFKDPFDWFACYKTALTFKTHPVVTLQIIHAESYDMNVRFLELLRSPSLDMDITNPAAGVPEVISWKYPGLTGDSGKWHSANTKSVIIPVVRISVSFGTQELFVT